MRRLLSLFLALGLLAACETNDLAEAPVPLGNFALGLNIAVADNMQKVPISRDASVADWEASIIRAVENRFRRYDGTKTFNIGINVDAYALAPPGIPIVASPKSVLVVSANIFDDAAGVKLNAEPKQLMVFEGVSGDSLIGSGLTRTKAEQMEALSYNAVKAVERWLAENPQWFGLAAAPLPAGAAAAPVVATSATSAMPALLPALLPAN